MPNNKSVNDKIMLLTEQHMALCQEQLYIHAYLSNPDVNAEEFAKDIIVLINRHNVFMSEITKLMPEIAKIQEQAVRDYYISKFNRMYYKQFMAFFKIQNAFASIKLTEDNSFVTTAFNELHAVQDKFKQQIVQNKNPHNNSVDDKIMLLTERHMALYHDQLYIHAYLSNPNVNAEEFAKDIIDLINKYYAFMSEITELMPEIENIQEQAERDYYIGEFNEMYHAQRRLFFKIQNAFARIKTPADNPLIQTALYALNYVQDKFKQQIVKNKKPLNKCLEMLEELSCGQSKLDTQDHNVIVYSMELELRQMAVVYIETNPDILNNKKNATFLVNILNKKELSLETKEALLSALANAMCTKTTPTMNDPTSDYIMQNLSDDNKQELLKAIYNQYWEEQCDKGASIMPNRLRFIRFLLSNLDETHVIAFLNELVAQFHDRNVFYKSRFIFNNVVQVMVRQGKYDVLKNFVKQNSTAATAQIVIHNIFKQLVNSQEDPLVSRVDLPKSRVILDIIEINDTQQELANYIAAARIYLRYSNNEIDLGQLHFDLNELWITMNESTPLDRDASAILIKIIDIESKKPHNDLVVEEIEQLQQLKEDILDKLASDDPKPFLPSNGPQGGKKSENPKHRIVKGKRWPPPEPPPYPPPASSPRAR